MKYVRYEGSFLSREGVEWTARIMQEADDAYDEVGELEFPADSPLEIEWDSAAKEEPVCGSTATLTLISPGDRTYLDLYSITPGEIRLDVYREDILYWSGCLDPEFYEEPYAYGDSYEVSFTFSDFGILERLSYNLSGMQTLEAILEDALSRSGILYLDIDQSLISTYVDDDTRATLDTLMVRSDNFFDEDGNAATLMETLEGIIQPLSLKMQQKAGTIWIYDINGLYESGGSSQITWASDDQVLGTDKVANNVIITFSPYADSQLTPEFVYEGEYSESITNLTSTAPSSGPEVYSYYPDYGEAHMDSGVDYWDLSFSIFISDEASGIAFLHSSCAYFHTVPLLGGEETEGIAHFFRTGGHGSLSTGWPVLKPMTGSASMGGLTVIFTSEKVFLPGLSSSDQSTTLIRLALDMLLDPRYNYNTDAGSDNESGNYSTVEDITGLFVPVYVRLYDDDGNVIYHYTNQAVYTDYSSTTSARINLTYTKGSWEEGDASWYDCLLQYYDPDDSGACAVLGWKTNRQCVGMGRSLWPSLAAIDDGQYMPYPPEGGWLEVSVMAGVMPYTKTSAWKEWVEDLVDGDTSWPNDDDDLVEITRWKLFHAPVIEVLKNDITHSEVSSEDVEYAGVINEDAKDDITIDTICGTMEDIVLTAKGLYFNASTGEAISSLIRAGRVTQAEQLLIGTLYSQYAARKMTLSGTAEIMSGGLRWYYDEASDGVRLMLLSEVQDVIADTSEITAAEFTCDEYESDSNG